MKLENPPRRYAVLWLALLLLLACCALPQDVAVPSGSTSSPTEGAVPTTPLSISTPPPTPTATLLPLLSYDDFTEAMGQLDRTLAVQEPETYAGLCIPTPGRREAIITFTTDAAETARPYLVDQRYESQVRVETADFPFKLLKDNLRAEFERLIDLGFEAVGRVDRCENRIVLDVLSHSDVEAALKAANIQLPDYVKLVEVESMPILESP